MSEQESSHNGLVLIVDDIPKNLQLLGKTLRDEGYDVAAASDGEHALQNARTYHPDLILLDVMMPGMDGFEVCRRLKNDEELQSIRVIFLTAKTAQEDIVRGLELGGSDYITKPFNTKELLARVETHVQLKCSEDQIRKKNEELRKMTEAKDRIYSVIGHDLRNSLGAVASLTDLLMMDLQEDMDYEKLEDFLLMIDQSVTNTTNLLNDLMSWARLQTGDMSMRLTEFSPVQVVWDTIDLFTISVNKKNLSVDFRFDEERSLISDERMVATVIRNFFSNAIKFSHKEGEVDILLKYEDDYCAISVEDNGRGMSREVQEKLFDKNTHPSKDGTSKEKGAGFGLLLCKRLADKLEGEITVRSTPGEGSTFLFRFPVNG